MTRLFLGLGSHRIASGEADLISRLAAAGLLSKLDALQIYCRATADEALRDLINPARTPTATADFVAGVGFVTGVNKVVDMGFGPTTAGTTMAQNDSLFGFFSTTDEATSGSIAGAFDGTRGTTIQIRNGSGVGGYRNNQNSVTSTGTSNFNASGLWAVSRTAVGTSKLFQNATERWNVSDASTAEATTNFFLGGINAAGGGIKTFNAAFAGTAFTNAQMADFNTILREFLANFGIS